MFNSKQHQHFIVNSNFLLNPTEVTYVKLQDKNRLLYGKDKKLLIHIPEFEESPFLTNGFIKISSQVYVNANYITAINLKDLNIELNNGMHLSYNKENETKLQAYIATIC